jgi:hypothetical protein
MAEIYTLMIYHLQILGSILSEEVKDKVYQFLHCVFELFHKLKHEDWMKLELKITTYAFHSTHRYFFSDIMHRSNPMETLSDARILQGYLIAAHVLSRYSSTKFLFESKLNQLSFAHRPPIITRRRNTITKSFQFSAKARAVRYAWILSTPQGYMLAMNTVVCIANSWSFSLDK